MQQKLAAIKWQWTFQNDSQIPGAFDMFYQQLVEHKKSNYSFPNYFEPDIDPKNAIGNAVWYGREFRVRKGSTGPQYYHSDKKH